jgi:hypothetical protein
VYGVADSSTERVHRHRRHRNGDHSLCIPGRCKAVAPELRRIMGSAKERQTQAAETGFDGAGARLWAEVTALGELGPLQSVLLVEACRIADRLDVLDRQLHGGDWLRFRHDESGTEVTVYVDRVLAEAREQATALRGVIVELIKYVGVKEPEKKGGGPLADLAARRAARSAQAAN